MAALQPFGLAARYAQADGEIVGQLIAAGRQDGGMAQRAAIEDRDAGGAGADIDHRRAQHLFVARQHGLGRGHVADDRVGHRDAAAADALEQVEHRGGTAGDDVQIDLEPRPEHPDRIHHLVLLVDGELLRDRVEDLASLGQRQRTRRRDRAIGVVARDAP